MFIDTETAMHVILKKAPEGLTQLFAVYGRLTIDAE